MLENTLINLNYKKLFKFNQNIMIRKGEDSEIIIKGTKIVFKSKNLNYL